MWSRETGSGLPRQVLHYPIHNRIGNLPLHAWDDTVVMILWYFTKWLLKMNGKVIPNDIVLQYLAVRVISMTCCIFLVTCLGLQIV